MSFSKPPQFITAIISQIREETPLLTHVQLAPVPDHFRSSYVTAGQYVQLKADCGDEKPGFFALASKPGAPEFEFLIKRGTPLTDRLIGKQPGDSIFLSAPAGKGYPLGEAKQKDLVLVGVGSGLAPLRGVLHYVREHRSEYGRVWLFYGAHSRKDIPYQLELDTLSSNNIDVNLVCSQPEPGTWSGETGYVQDAFRRRFTELPGDACLLVCGMKALVEDLRRIGPELGLPADRIYQNF